ncbi:transcriptional regulator NrdR [Sulfuriroseicoccus oceanibius]|uniref:Transcriptional repressor NrdR n=1 Tax=Sulfuriroseicoccus oceanibius TaxID=2707525 RepID=A0A6B3L2U2_9BACT|nr:transcriptional regulator NrdR [Sulfuriroseicoccus oceanibius]QQL46160.1 transcriptional repressor NrdR [Sulfuriroseicoccus oceanibius]
MRCIRCGCVDDKVIDSRMSKDGSAIRRRRECVKCAHRFTTYETLEQSTLAVVKRDGRREDFKRDKLSRGVIKACEKRPVPMDVIDRAVEDIILELQSDNVREVPAATIGNKVMTALREIDPVAYVRYASVYRQFQDVGEFINEIESMERTIRRKSEQPDLFK